MKKKEKKVPFFANLLENQISADTVVGGDRDKGKDTTNYYYDHPTMKYPSDDDEPTFEPEIRW